MSNTLSTPALIKAGARASPLSKAQVEEVEQALGLKFSMTWVETLGDRDKVTSLRELEKTDFFTRELDQLLASNTIDCAIHSAKDLPDPLPKGLEIVAVTKGKDPSDVLVMREGRPLFPNATIATSSIRREEAVRELEPDVNFVDLRGTIHERLEKLNEGMIDGIVVAEAAILRLGLTHLPRTTLPGDTTPYQGRLALVARQGDLAMRQLGQKIDHRNRVLYLGLDCPESTLESVYQHLPVIKCEKTTVRCPDFSQCTHALFTSKMAVNYLSLRLPESCVILAIGLKTAEKLKEAGFSPHHIAEKSTSTGVLEMIDQLEKKPDALFWPHSKQSLPTIQEGLQKRGIPLVEWVLYETKIKVPERLIPLDEIDEIFFTSPSTVKGFIKAYGKLPKDKTLIPIGETTADFIALKKSI